MTGLAIFSVALILADLVIPDLAPGDRALILGVDFLVCVVFWFDFVLRLRREGGRRTYLRSHWYEPVGMVPAALFVLVESQTALGIIARTFRLVGAAARLTRFTAASKSIFHRMHLVPFGIIVFVVVLTAGTLVYEFERNAEGSNIRTVADGIWYTLATVTTVGYGDRVPVTAAGRTLGALTMLAGITLFGTLVALMGSAFATRWTRAFEDEDRERTFIQKRLNEAKDLSDEEVRALTKRVEDYCRGQRGKSG